MAKHRLPYELHLIASGESFGSAGRPLASVPPLSARIDASQPVPRVTVRLAEISTAELRWCLDKALRPLRALFALGPVALSASAAVADDTVLAIALDLHLASHGRVRLAERNRVAMELERIGGAQDLYRAWVNEDPTTRTSVQIATDVTEWAADRADVTVEVLDEAALTEKGLRLLLAVGGASTLSPPRLVIARYQPADADPETAPTMLLGKGVTFDTGGINVKPYESYVSMMKNDMAGAALAWVLFKALVEGGSTAPWALVLPTCENPIDAGSMRPGSIVESYSGKKVRIDHTDAEGRLILADGLSYGIETLAPRRVISFATLTTAALISYGPYATPVHFPDATLEDGLSSAGRALGEDVHFFERRAWHFEANRDEEADLRNTARLPGNARRAAGSRNAAHFLLHFAGDVPLTHLDIFASTWNWAGDAPGSGYGATGAPLRTVLRALENGA